ncbi:MAG: N-acetylmuramoyl-L-alanine amidase [Thiomicrorhabdus sp.]|nr:MAG: N-acetylmuramoyl-L-alanine amidase [Thiomicrorhabdus sp.]
MKNLMKTINMTPITLSLISMLIMTLWVSSAVAAPKVESMRIGQTADKTRVVFDIKGLRSNSYKVSQLSNPSRLVVDFYKADNKLTFKNKHITDTRLFKVRVSQTKKRVRVVLDLHKHGSHRVFSLAKNAKGNERLVIDLKDRKIGKTTAKKNSKRVTKKLVAKKVSKPVVKTVAKTVAKPVVKVASASSVPTVKQEKILAKLSKLAKAKTESKTKTHPATHDILNRDSSVFTKNEDLVVALDAGHGGKDVGAIGHNKTYEKVATLLMAKELKRLIDRQPGMRAVLTRNKDVFIPLKKRVEIAKSHNADIFISVHADAFHDHSVRGGSIYVLSQGGASSVMAKLLAKSENASLQDIKLEGRDDDVAFALSDLTREATVRSSRKLAQTVLGEMQKKVKMHKHSVQSAGFAVLRSIDMPSLLIETAFISNPHEARNLMSRKFQTKMASAIVSGLNKFVDQNAQKPRWGESLYVYYKVQRGDTLSEIAENNQVSVRELKKLNRIRNANELYIGKKMKIPLSEKLIAGL